MIFQAINDDAPSGARIHSAVTLLWDEDEPFTPKPWRAVTTVDSHTMATSHHATCNEAKRNAEKMHSAYLDVHSDYPEYRELRAAEEANA